MPTVPLFHREHLAVLATFASSNLLVALDYDGTLAPIADRPEHAAMRPDTRRLLTQVAHAYPTVVISGRALDDLSNQLAGIPLWHLFGNHGIEAQPGTPGRETRDWIAPLRSALPGGLGVRIEDKAHTLTLHYRGVPDPVRARAAIAAAVATLPDVVVVDGKDAVNVLPRGRGDKGDALRDALRMFACSHAIYVGDDDTDEAAFAAQDTGRVLAVRVEASHASRARYHLESQGDIDWLLTALADARPDVRVRPPGSTGPA